ncbi:hypothetical protein HYW75_03465 [Candidatus Pacearchaeota archaeon]|nr:hypothetical protein [Candidatus Pacearchaeota archaeon]
MIKNINHDHHKNIPAEKKESIQISKKTLLYGLLILIIAAFFLFYSLKYLPEKNKVSDINLYKKALYDSILCQFSCPLLPSKSQNTTVFLPDQICQKICIAELKAMNLNTTKYSQQDLISDNLASDINNIILDCKNLYSIKQPIVNGTSSNNTSQTIPINTTAYFPCVKLGLIGLQDNYPYIIDIEKENNTMST